MMDKPDWFKILRMGGAITSTSSGTLALFNNKAIRRKKDEEE